MVVSKWLRGMLAAILILSFQQTCLAQPGDPDDPDGVPIDGGVSILLGTGIAVGVYTLRKKK